MSEGKIRVKFVGTNPRTNSFGYYEPGKTYTLDEGTARELCKVPRLFQNIDSLPGLRKQMIPEGPQNPRKVGGDKETDKGKSETGSGESKYDKFGVRKLKDICKKKRVKVPRNTRKPGIIELLVEHDRMVSDG